MTHSTKRTRPKKPHQDFPLFRHPRGYWAKKVRGKHCYFGRIADDPTGKAALALWLEQKDDLLAGRTPRANKDGLTLAELCNRFLTAKEQQRDAGDIRPTTFSDYYATCKHLVDTFGKRRLVEDLVATDFQNLRAKLAKRLGPHALSREVQQIRTLFKYGLESGLIERPVRFGPNSRSRRIASFGLIGRKRGARMFEAAQIRTLLPVWPINR